MILYYSNTLVQGRSWHEDRLRMANDAIPVATPDVNHQFGLKGALHPPAVSEKGHNGSFLAQVSNNPFFTAVSTPELRG